MDEDNLESLESSLGTEETSKYRFVCSCFFPSFPLESLLVCSFFIMRVFSDNPIVHFKIFIFSVVMFTLHGHTHVPGLVESFRLLNLTADHQCTYKWLSS